MSEVEEKVEKCKQYLEADLDDSKLLYVLKKLAHLEITIDILQNTGIGKVVNSFRKQNGQVGEKARVIVNSWKKLVAAEAEKLQEEQEEAEEERNSEKENTDSANSSAESEAEEMSIGKVNDVSDDDNKEVIRDTERKHKHKSNQPSTDDKVKSERNDERKSSKSHRHSSHSSEDRHKSSSSKTKHEARDSKGIDKTDKHRSDKDRHKHSTDRIENDRLNDSSKECRSISDNRKNSSSSHKSHSEKHKLKENKIEEKHSSKTCDEKNKHKSVPNQNHNVKETDSKKRNHGAVPDKDKHGKLNSKEDGEKEEHDSKTHKLRHEKNHSKGDSVNDRNSSDKSGDTDAHDKTHDSVHKIDRKSEKRKSDNHHRSYNSDNTNRQSDSSQNLDKVDVKQKSRSATETNQHISGSTIKKERSKHSKSKEHTRSHKNEEVVDRKSDKESFDSAHKHHSDEHDKKRTDKNRNLGEKSSEKRQKTSSSEDGNNANTSLKTNSETDIAMEDSDSKRKNMDNIDNKSESYATDELKQPVNEESVTDSKEKLIESFKELVNIFGIKDSSKDAEKHSVDNINITEASMQPPSFESNSKLATDKGKDEDKKLNQPIITKLTASNGSKTKEDIEKEFLIKEWEALKRKIEKHQEYESKKDCEVKSLADNHNLTENKKMPTEAIHVETDKDVSEQVDNEERCLKRVESATEIEQSQKEKGLSKGDPSIFSIENNDQRKYEGADNYKSEKETTKQYFDSKQRHEKMNSELKTEKQEHAKPKHSESGQKERKSGRKEYRHEAGRKSERSSCSESDESTYKSSLKSNKSKNKKSKHKKKSKKSKKKSRDNNKSHKKHSKRSRSPSSDRSRSPRRKRHKSEKERSMSRSPKKRKRSLSRSPIRKRHKSERDKHFSPPRKVSDHGSSNTSKRNHDRRDSERSLSRSPRRRNSESYRRDKNDREIGRWRHRSRSPGSHKSRHSKDDRHGDESTKRQNSEVGKTRSKNSDDIKLQTKEDRDQKTKSKKGHRQKRTWSTDSDSSLSRSPSPAKIKYVNEDTNDSWAAKAVVNRAKTQDKKSDIDDILETDSRRKNYLKSQIMSGNISRKEQEKHKSIVDNKPTKDQLYQSQVVKCEKQEIAHLMNISEGSKNKDSDESPSKNHPSDLKDSTSGRRKEDAESRTITSDVFDETDKAGGQEQHTVKEMPKDCSLNSEQKMYSDDKNDDIREERLKRNNEKNRHIEHQENDKLEKNKSEKTDRAEKHYLEDRDKDDRQEHLERQKHDKHEKKNSESHKSERYEKHAKHKSHTVDKTEEKYKESVKQEKHDKHYGKGKDYCKFDKHDNRRDDRHKSDRVNKTDKHICDNVIISDSKNREKASEKVKHSISTENESRKFEKSDHSDKDGHSKSDKDKSRSLENDKSAKLDKMKSGKSETKDESSNDYKNEKDQKDSKSSRHGASSSHKSHKSDKDRKHKDTRKSDSGKDKHHKSSKSSKSSKDHKHKVPEPENFEDMLCFDNSDAVSITTTSGSAKKIDDKYENLKAKFKIKKISESNTLGKGGKIEKPTLNTKIYELKARESPKKAGHDDNLQSSLPSTQAHYRPYRFSNMEHKKIAEDDSAPFLGIKTNSRTQVYSGKKQTGLTEMHTLFDLCIRVLQDNIDCLDYVGGVPFDILKPVLEKCTPKQLYDLEDYNPHFLEDSDNLWKIHCEREFRGSKREEMETWRELYLRKFDEREEKFKSIKANISKSIANQAPERRTKLAFIDNVAKPPREVRRQQIKFGTSNTIQTKSGAGNSVKNRFQAVDMITLGRERQQQHAEKQQGPMMKKTLSMMNKLYRR